jgi:galactokinase
MKQPLFVQIYGVKPEILSSAPGRINIIGEHTDYNGGYVLPAAIHLRNYFLASPRNDGQVNIRAADFDEEDRFTIDGIIPSKTKRWANYVRGIFWVLAQAGYRLRGINGLIWGEVPLESGLSSSAALEVSIIMGLSVLFQIEIPPVELAKLAQKAENDFVGVKCGLMDQFIAVFGREDSALFLDCETLHFSHFPLNLEKKGLSLVVYDTRVRRKLATSEYNTRRQQASDALAILKTKGVRSYKKATLAVLEDAAARMDGILYRRAKHVISENERVQKAVVALQADDFQTLGDLLFQSHLSLRDDYEVSCPELDLLYSVGRKFSGCWGARLVGAGFGGSGIALLEKSKSKDFRMAMLAAASKKNFPEPQFHEVFVGGGAAATRSS